MMIALSIACVVLMLLMTTVSAQRPEKKSYLPGVNPHFFQEGDGISLKVNKLTSVSTQLPLDTYHFPFCFPEGGPKLDNENLGEFLAGDRIQSSPYVILMKKDMYCEQVCLSNLGLGEGPKLKSSKVVRAIRRGYHHNWILDNLSAGSKAMKHYIITTKFWGGFPVGFVAHDNQKSYINNHVNIEIFYHPTNNSPSDYQIVRFVVQPFSIKHEFDATNSEDGETGSMLPPVVKINNPIVSCDPQIPYRNRPHTNFEFISDDGRQPQPASGKVLFTYDVIWTADYETTWPDRWNVYLSMNGVVPPEEHWRLLRGSAVVVCLLAYGLVAHVVRNLRDEVARFGDLEEEPNESESAGADWLKTIYPDAFRPPQTCPRLYVAACGTGAQILATTLATIIFAYIGYWNPARRGSLLMGIIVLFVLAGSINGYAAARLYKTFFGQECYKLINVTALLFPGICFGWYIILSLFLFLPNQSTLSLPIATVFVLFFLAVAVLYPLVRLGAWLGYRQGAIEFVPSPATTTNEMPNPIPPQPWTASDHFTLFVGGLPFWVCLSKEAYYMLAATWAEYYYYEFGFLLMAFSLLVVMSAQVTVHCLYWQLPHGNHEWWWRSFGNAGAVAIHGYFYSLWFSVSYTSQRHILLSDDIEEGFLMRLSAKFFYMGSMALVCLAMFCMMGFIGMVASLCFHKAVFASVRVKMGYELLGDDEDDDAVQMLAVDKEGDGGEDEPCT